MEMTAAYLAAKRMRSLNKPSRKREYDYFSACGVGDSSGVADGDSVAVGVSDGRALGAILLLPFDDLFRRHMRTMSGLLIAPPAPFSCPFEHGLVERYVTASLSS